MPEIHPIYLTSLFVFFFELIVSSPVGGQSTVTSNEPYSLSYSAGGYDAQRDFLGGTELMNLAGFQGRLYAGIGYWMDRPHQFNQDHDPRSGAQILVLDAKNSQWRQEHAFDQKDVAGNPKYGRLTALEVIRLHRFDAGGNAVGPLAVLLIIGLEGSNGAIYTQSAPGNWVDTQLPTAISIRSVAVHYDATDKTEKIYVGAGGDPGENPDRPIYSGVYDPSAPGRIRWNPTPEYIGIPSRVMSMVDCGGVLFAAAKPSVVRRNDARKSWEVVYSYPVSFPFDRTKYASGFRGLTCNDGGRTLLSGFEGIAGDIVKINTQTGAAVVELHARQFLAQRWGYPPTAIEPDIIVGYNDIPLVKRNPETRLFGLLTRSPKAEEQNSAWFLSRTAGNPPLYGLSEVRAPNWPHWRSDAALWSVRAIAVSPFPEDQGQALYLGGYDGHFQPDHNTAWLYRVGLETALARYRDERR